MKIIPHTLAAILSLAASAAAAQGLVETPGTHSAMSGVDVISGWHCTAKRIDILIDNLPVLTAGSGTDRADTQSVCGRKDTGFSLLFNFNLLPKDCFGCRFHKLTAFADGMPFANVTFEVEHFGVEYLRGKVAQYPLYNFPAIGSITWVRWDEERQNFGTWLTDTQQVSPAGTYHGAVELGPHNPACGPFPPGGPPLSVKLGTFVVATSADTMSFSAQFADGTTCQASAAPLEPFESTSSEGYLGATFPADATAACPYLQGGVRLRVNGKRLVGNTNDGCDGAHLMGAKF